MYKGGRSPLGQALQLKEISEARHLMHLDEKRWLWVEKVKERYELPNSHYLMVAQALTFCRSRLSDLSMEVGQTTIDEMLALQPGTFRVSDLCKILIDRLLTVTCGDSFKR